MNDLESKIIELMDLFDGEVTTADKIDRPERALEKEAYDDFNKRNPMAGGGMLVQPSADGSRPGYAKDEYSRIMALGVDELKELGFTGKKTKKVKAPGSGKPYSKLTDEFKSWVREQTAASPDYRRKDIQFKTRELRVINAIENAFNQNDVRHIITKDKFNKVGSFKASDYPIITAMKKDPEKLKSISAQTNIPEDDLLNLLEDRDVFIKNKYNDVRNLSVAERTKPKKKFYASAEKWILRNSKRYADPEKFYNAFIRTFGEDNHFIKSIKSGKKTGFKVAFSNEFVENVLGLKSQTSVNSKQLKDIFKTSIYTNNPNVKQKIVDTLTDIIPTNIKFAKDYDVRNALLENPLLKKFGLNQSIKGPIAKLLADDLIDITLKDISSFRKPFLGTRQLLSYLSNRVDPKYQTMFKEATQAVIYAQNNQWKDAKAALNLSQKIMFDHKIPQALIKLGYADDLDYIKLTPTSEDFNTKVKLKQFDQPMITLANEFSKPTTSLDRKAEIVQQMKILQTNFNSKYGNYLGSIDINYDNKTGKLKLTNVDPVVTKKTDFVSSLGKSLTQTGEINKKQLNNLLSELAAEIDPDGCGRKTGATGGRIGFKFGSTVCATKAKNYLNQVVDRGIQNEPSARVGLIKKIISGTGNFIKQNLSPSELFKLENLIGKPALYATAAIESGLLADDVLRKKEPINVAAAENFLVGNLLNLDADAERAKNIINDPNLSPAAKTYAQGIIDQDNFRKLSQTYATNLVKNPLFIPSGAKAKADTALANLKNKIINTSETGRMDYESLLADKSDFDTAGEYVGEPNAAGFARDSKGNLRKVNKFGYAGRDAGFDAPDKPGLPSFTSGQLEKRNVPGEFVIDPSFPLPLQRETLVPSYVSPSYSPERPEYETDEFINEYLKSIGGEPLRPGEGTLIRMNMPQLGLFGTQERFARGGLSGEDKSGPPPERGPNSQGLSSLMKRGTNI